MTVPVVPLLKDQRFESLPGYGTTEKARKTLDGREASCLRRDTTKADGGAPLLAPTFDGELAAWRSFPLSHSGATNTVATRKLTIPVKDDGVGRQGNTVISVSLLYHATAHRLLTP